MRDAAINRPYEFKVWRQAIQRGTQVMGWYPMTKRAPTTNAACKVPYCFAFAGGGSEGISLNAKESGSQDYRPYLTIDYIPEPATLSLLVLGGLAVMKRRRR